MLSHAMLPEGVNQPFDGGDLRFDGDAAKFQLACEAKRSCPPSSE